MLEIELSVCRSTLVVPYSFKDVAFGQKVAQSADRPTLLFFRHAPSLEPCLNCRRPGEHSP